MTGIFTYIYHRNQPNVGKYTIHGWYGYIHVDSQSFIYDGFILFVTFNFSGSKARAFSSSFPCWRSRFSGDGGMGELTCHGPLEINGWKMGMSFSVAKEGLPSGANC